MARKATIKATIHNEAYFKYKEELRLSNEQKSTSRKKATAKKTKADNDKAGEESSR